MKSKNKELFETHVSSYWVTYLLYAICAIFIWCYAVTLFTKDRPKEVVTLWIMAYDINQEEYTNYLENNKPDYLKHVRVTFELKGNEYASIKYQGIGASCDIVILPESFINSFLNVSNYIELDTETINELYGDIEYYYINNKPYGIKIFDSNDIDNGLIKYTKEDTENENYYIFLNIKSLHMDNLNNSKYDGGLEVLRLILDGPII